MRFSRWQAHGNVYLVAEAAGLTGVPFGGMVTRSEVIVSVCPPHAARDVARQVAGFGGLYLDANAISPAIAKIRIRNITDPKELS